MDELTGGVSCRESRSKKSWPTIGGFRRSTSVTTQSIAGNTNVMPSGAEKPRRHAEKRCRHAEKQCRRAEKQYRLADKRCQCAEKRCRRTKWRCRRAENRYRRQCTLWRCRGPKRRYRQSEKRCRHTKRRCQCADLLRNDVDANTPRVDAKVMAMNLEPMPTR